MTIATYPWPRLAILVAVLVLFSFSACRNDDDDGPADAQVVELRHDGDNVTGPILGVGYHELAARFTRSDVADLIGGQLEEVRFYLGRIPNQVEVIVYGEGSANTPGPERFAQDISASITTTGFQSFRLPQNLDILDEELWISIGVRHDQTQQSVGCDDGPAQTGGDMLFRSTDTDWTTFEQATGESVNWNIRGLVRRPQ